MHDTMFRKINLCSFNILVTIIHLITKKYREKVNLQLIILFRCKRPWYRTSTTASRYDSGSSLIDKLHWYNLRLLSISLKNDTLCQNHQQFTHCWGLLQMCQNLQPTWFLLLTCKKHKNRVQITMFKSVSQNKPIFTIQKPKSML